METDEPVDIRKSKKLPNPVEQQPRASEIDTKPVEHSIRNPQETPPTTPVVEKPEKKKRNYTAEQRKAAGDRIRAINAERIAKCRARNEAVLLAREERALEQLRKLDKQREYIATPAAERHSLALDKPTTKAEVQASAHVPPPKKSPTKKRNLLCHPVKVLRLTIHHPAKTNYPLPHLPKRNRLRKTISSPQWKKLNHNLNPLSSHHPAPVSFKR